MSVAPSPGNDGNSTPNRGGWPFEPETGSDDVGAIVFEGKEIGLEPTPKNEDDLKERFYENLRALHSQNPKFFGKLPDIDSLTHDKGRDWAERVFFWWKDPFGQKPSRYQLKWNVADGVDTTNFMNFRRTLRLNIVDSPKVYDLHGKTIENETDVFYLTEEDKKKHIAFQIFPEQEKVKPYIVIHGFKRIGGSANRNLHAAAYIAAISTAWTDGLAPHETVKISLTGPEEFKARTYVAWAMAKMNFDPNHPENTRCKINIKEYVPSDKELRKAGIKNPQKFREKLKEKIAEEQKFIKEEKDRLQKNQANPNATPGAVGPTSGGGGTPPSGAGGPTSGGGGTPPSGAGGPTSGSGGTTPPINARMALYKYMHALINAATGYDKESKSEKLLPSQGEEKVETTETKEVPPLLPSPKKITDTSRLLGPGSSPKKFGM